LGTLQVPGSRSRLFIADLFAHFFQNPKLGGGLYVCSYERHVVNTGCRK